MTEEQTAKLLRLRGLVSRKLRSIPKVAFEDAVSLAMDLGREADELRKGVRCSCGAKATQCVDCASIIAANAAEDEPSGGKSAGRKVCVTRLVEGEILIGNTITISSVLYGDSRRRVYRGVVYWIGNDEAHMTVLGFEQPLVIRLEPCSAKLPPFNPAAA